MISEIIAFTWERVGVRVPTTLVLVLFSACATGMEKNGQATTQQEALEAVCPGGCPTGKLCCLVGAQSYCFDTNSELNHCGGCSKGCDAHHANRCVAGKCQCGYGPECAAGLECCEAGCKNVQSDGANCGGCGLRCGTGTTCVNGQCLCGSTVCAAGETCCNGKCTNVLSDAQNCGRCGQACTGAVSACQNGWCGCPGGGTPCPPTGTGVLLTCCATGCVDLCNNPGNCGMCAKSCTAGICKAGMCVIDMFSGTGGTTSLPPQECLQSLVGP